MKGLVDFFLGRRGAKGGSVFVLTGRGWALFGQNVVAKVSLLPFDLVGFSIISAIIVIVIIIGSATIFCGLPESGLGLQVFSDLFRSAAAWGRLEPGTGVSALSRLYPDGWNHWQFSTMFVDACAAGVSAEDGIGDAAVLHRATR